jgi:DNA-binding transcriptional MerR regulator
VAKDGIFSVGDFAKFSRTTRDTLLYYDKIGLLSPISRKGNRYRCYSQGQLAFVNVIRVLQAFGMTLAQIRDYIDSRTPESTNALFSGQIVKIDEEIEKWERARKLLHSMKRCITSVVNIDETAITVRRMPETAVVMGDHIRYERGIDPYEALLEFYHDASDKYPGMDLNYPVWGRFSMERIKNGDWRWPDRYYFDNPEGEDRRPAGLYAVGYARGGYGHCGDLYKRMTDHIDANGYEIAGHAYEEYPLNEISVSDEADYLIRLLIEVKKKDCTPG